MPGPIRNDIVPWCYLGYILAGCDQYGDGDGADARGGGAPAFYKLWGVIGYYNDDLYWNFDEYQRQEAYG